MTFFDLNWLPLSKWQIVSSGERRAMALRRAAAARDDFMRESMEQPTILLE